MPIKGKKISKDDFLNPEIFKKKSTKTLHWEFDNVGATCSLKGSSGDASNIKNSTAASLVQDKMCQNKNYFQR